MKKNSSWVIAASEKALEKLKPLIDFRAARQPVCVLPNGVKQLLANPPSMLPENVEAVLVVGSSELSPQEALPGLYLNDGHKRQIPVGWLPDEGQRLVTYAKAHALALNRPKGNGPIILLGQWQDRFLKVARQTSKWFKRHAPSKTVFNWTADRICAPEMIRGLALGPAIAIYCGHGRSNGWAAYHGIRANHFNEPWPEPIGIMLALCCENASRQLKGISFAEELALRGVFVGALAATEETKYIDNQFLGRAFRTALGLNEVQTLADLIALADIPADFWKDSSYRFIGDPMAPLAGAETAHEQAAMVFAPAPDEELPPWPNDDLEEN